MKVLIDTNVVIDFLCNRQPYFSEAYEIIKYTASNKVSSFITANSIKDIFYLLRKSSPIKEVKEDLCNLLEIIDVVDVTKKDIENVLLR